MSTAFTRLLGTTQGRIKPANASAVQGDYVAVLGSDVPGVVATFNLNDGVLLAQTADLTGIDFIRINATVRPPASMPAGVKWQLQWGLGGAINGQRDIPPGRTTTIRDAVISTHLYTGNQAIRIRLKLVPA